MARYFNRSIICYYLKQNYRWPAIIRGLVEAVIMSANKNSQRINDDAWWRVWWRRFRNDFSSAEPEKQVAQIYYITAVLAVLGSLLAGLWAFGEHLWPDKSATAIQK